MEHPQHFTRGLPAPRRVVTAPINLPAARRDTRDSGSLVETLYYHPNAKIIAFTATGRAFSASPTRSSAALNEEEEAGTLSWSSQLERTIAVGSHSLGPVRIYRAPGSVAFLNCGSALQPILPKSQCWCIDEMNSRFILQIRRPNYWRIELPVDNSQDSQLAEHFREVLGRILQFEKTKCPFKRSFTVVLPEPPKVPVVKKPWRPVRQSLPNMDRRSASPTTDSSPAPSQRRASVSPVRIPDDTFQDNTLQDEPIRWEPATALDARQPKEPVESPRATQLIPVWEKLSKKREPVVEVELQPPNEPVPTYHTQPSNVSNTILPRSSQSPTSEPSIGRKDIPTSIPSSDSEANIDVHTDTDTVILNQAPVVGGTVHEPLGDLSSSEATDAPSDEENAMYELHEGAGSQRRRMKARLRRTALFHSSPRLSSMPDLKLTTTVYKPCKISASDSESDEQTDVSPTGSQDSFHSVESWHSYTKPVLPSPPASPPKLMNLPAHSSHTEEFDAPGLKGISAAHAIIHDQEITSPNEVADESDASVATAPDEPLTMGGANQWAFRQPNGTGTSTAVGIRGYNATQRTWTGGRALSPVTSAAGATPTLSGPSRSRLYNNGIGVVKSIPMAIIARTCEILLGPPNYLITLMLKVAAKITAGEWRGQVFGQGDDGETIPVQWDYSEGDLTDWSDDETPYMDAAQGQPPL
ncbi:hypothetical protein S40288_05718 [Stachybotrys chartarum IBT 40288]|nr:hypothetical protein S40288_05718 [Stachybotrys chartarum IBT 40288]